MADDEIIQRISIEGEDEVESALKGIGDASEEQLGRLNASAASASESLASLGNAGAQIKDGLAGVGSGMSDAGGGIADVGDKAEKADLGLGKLAGSMRTLGRVAHIPELSRASGLLRLLAANAELAAVAIGALAVVMAGKLANSAATAANDFAALAISLGLTNEELGRLENIARVAGVSVEDMKASLDAVGKMTKEAAAGTKQMNAEIMAARENLAKVREANNQAFAEKAAAEQYTKQIDALNESMKFLQNSIKALDPLDPASAGKRASVQALIDMTNQLTATQQKNKEQTAQNLKDADEMTTRRENEVKAEKQYQEAQTKSIGTLSEIGGAAGATASALNKLGISGLDSAGKIAKQKEVLAQIADVLSNTANAADKLKIKQDLMAGGIKPEVIKMLEQGAAAFRKLDEEAAKRKDIFTEDDFRKASEFKIAMNELSESFGHFSAYVGELVMPVIKWLANQFAQFPDNFKLFIENFKAIGIALSLFATWIDEKIKAPFKAIGDAFNTVVDGIKSAWQKAIDWFKETSFAKFFTDAWETVKTKWNEFIEWIKKTWTDLGTWFDSTWLGTLAGKVADAIKAAKAALGIGGGAAPAADSGGASLGEGAARGGFVRGPGTSTSDSIFARLSAGEFVTRAAAVRHYGANLMHAMNAMAVDRALLPGLALGGLVPARIPPVASSAPASHGRPINLTIDGTRFAGLSAPHDTAERIVKFAVARSVASTGRKPSWVR